MQPLLLPKLPENKFDPLLVQHAGINLAATIDVVERHDAVIRSDRSVVHVEALQKLRGRKRRGRKVAFIRVLKKLAVVEYGTLPVCVFVCTMGSKRAISVSLSRGRI